MTCFSFSLAERGESESKNRKFSWLRNFSAGSKAESRKSGSETGSQPVSQTPSDPSTEPNLSSSRHNLSESSSQRPRNLRIFSYGELKTATRNFYRGNLLGEGGFGCVYKGWIPDEQSNQGAMKMEVAIKQLNQKGQQGHKEWLAEVHFLGLVEHPNLVKLVGYCAEDDERGIQRLLVYEFMPNKSLEEHLFRRVPSVLPWNERLNIALGAARGLAYLHEEIMDLQVIFRDFKTSNILLDKDFCVKLSDFGLARQGPEPGFSHVSTAAVGTMGYAAPEYIQTGHLTAKSDVWSFGIVLLEILSGRRCIDRNRPKNEQRLLHWAKPYMQDSKKYHLILDPRLDGQYSLIQAQKIVSLLLQCLTKSPRTRPKMSDVSEKLQQLIGMSVTGSPQSSPSLTINQKMEVPTKEAAISSSGKRRLPLLREVRNMRGLEDARAMWCSLIPKRVRAGENL